MILTALALSAVISAEVARDMPADQVRPAASETLNVYTPRPYCGDLQQRVVARQREELKKLGRLPNAGRQYAVLRQVEGCPIPAPMGYHPGYVLPGAADAPMREDAPSNRR